LAREIIAKQLPLKQGLRQCFVESEESTCSNCKTTSTKTRIATPCNISYRF